jgi:molybdate transport system substrate-binding protein
MHFIKRVLFCLLLLVSNHALSDVLRIAAATNLRYVLPEITAKFKEITGHNVTVSYAASGTLTTQIIHGAPFQVFLSANPAYVKHLLAENRIETNVTTFAYGQLALFSATHAMLDVVKGIPSIKAALLQSKLKKVAIANPIHAPYGQAAKQQLEKYGLWDDIQPHLLVAENASQATQFTLSSRSSVGFIPFTHAIQPEISKKGAFVKLDSLLPQQAALVSPSSEVANAFVTFLSSNEAAELLTSQGFLLTGDK